MMGLFRRIAFCLLVGVLTIGLTAISCSNPEAEPDPIEAPASLKKSEPISGEGKTDAEVYAEAFDQMNINVDLTDEGFKPASIHIPAGRKIKLVVRNRGTGEHHYRVIGLTPRNLEWLAPNIDTEDIEAAIGTDVEHDMHHTTGFAPFRGESRAGIRPFGDEVHAYVDAAGGVDMVLFVALETGTYEVECPLHLEAVGKVTVF